MKASPTRFCFAIHIRSFIQQCLANFQASSVSSEVESTVQEDGAEPFTVDQEADIEEGEKTWNKL